MDICHLSFVFFSCEPSSSMMVQSVRPSVCLSVRLSVRPSVTPFSLCSYHRIIMKFSGVIIIDRSDVHAKGQGQKSKVKVTEVKTQLSPSRTITPVLIHVWQWNDADSFMWHRRGVLLFFKVFCQISRSHGTKKKTKKTHRFWHKAWSSIEEVSYCFSSSVKFRVHVGEKIANFDPNWAFPDCNSSLNSPLALKWCTKLDVV